MQATIQLSDVPKALKYPDDSRFTNLLGRHFGRLTVIQFAGSIKGHSHWICGCSCGEFSIVKQHSLRRGFTKSCGCLQRERTANRSLTHQQTVGRKRSPEYRTYLGAKGRCTNPNHHKWHLYGGRGIEFRFDSFEQFHAELGDRPTPQHSINRKDNNGHYEPGNVEWATPIEQAANRRPASYSKAK